ncbi:M57 family metalloprotease [Sorangium sp. So ce1389]|uniref:M57 family metalloprotease n=1 Tax=Sorangium sp. So ce1389 TaxID=3133336 RepID=UPI003F611DBD
MHRLDLHDLHAPGAPGPAAARLGWPWPEGCQWFQAGRARRFGVMNRDPSSPASRLLIDDPTRRSLEMEQRAPELRASSRCADFVRCRLRENHFGMQEKLNMKFQCVWGAVVCLALSGVVGCVASGDAGAESVADTTLSFDEFEALAYQEPETGVYIVDGDTPLPTRADLQRFWEEHMQPEALAINRVSGADDRWSAAAQQNISYCVSTAFGSNHGRVVQAMSAATAAWQAAASVRFVHRADQDGACSASNASVAFDVTPTSGQPYLARAFFPSYARANRNILIDGSSFGSIAPYTLAGVLRHELGHALGFRHEHTRPEAGTCFEDNSWGALTSYDAASVMHYPQCNGSNGGDLVLTALDRAGAAAAYGSPGPSCQPGLLSWTAQSLPHIIGRADADGWSANVAQDPVGYLQFGPYTTEITAGAHTAVWNLMIDNNTADNQEVVRVEVYDATTGTVLVSRDIRRGEWTSTFQYQSFSLPFMVDSARVGHQIELRAFWYRYAYIREQSVSLDPVCLPAQQTWSAQSLPHIIGRADADGWSADVAQDPAGYLQFGPYTTQVTAGVHTAIWNLMIDNNTADNQAIVKVDVYDATTGTVLASRNITRRKWTSAFQYQAFSLPFTMDTARAGHQIELRTFWYRYAYIREQSVSLH